MKENENIKKEQEKYNKNLTNNNRNINENSQKIKSSENEINQLKEENRNLKDKISKLEDEMKNLRNMFEQINYNNQNNGMEIENINFTPNNLESNGMFLPPEPQNNNNGLINNFLGEKIINICFKIDGKINISAQAKPNDKLGDLFMSALIKNNLMHLYNEKYTFIYDARNITDKYSYNESINTLHLIDNCIIEVHS